MRPLPRGKLRLAVWALFGISVTAFCIEYLSYLYNASKWPTLGEGMGNNLALKVLFVADPQIQGEKTESFFFGWLYRWDSDRYLKKNYGLAKKHISPDVIVFLGDLFDEGSTASDPEYRRYYQRFSRIFDLPTSENPSSIKYIFVPGDNDVGGERSEPVDEVKVNWFSKTFGDLKSITRFDGHGVNAQFLKMNLFIPNEYKDPLKGIENVINGNGTNKVDVRLIISHISLLSYVTDAVTQVIENFKPSIIFSAHTHKSSFVTYSVKETDKERKRSVLIYHDFLLPGHTTVTTSDPEIQKDIVKLESESQSQKTIKLDLNLDHSSEYLQEIMVPTCSYRMGTAKIGYGAMYLYANGTMEYTVLWLPSRFRQLLFYVAVYITMKVIITPILLFKCCSFAYARLRQSRFYDPNIYTKLV